MKYRVFFVIVGALLLISLPRESRGQGWEQTLQRLYPAAKEEGEVIFNTARVEEVGGKEGIEKFYKRFPGIKITFTAVSASTLPSRLITEARTGRVTIDALRGGPENAKPLVDRDLLITVNPKELTGHPVRTEFNNRYIDISHHLSHFGYNTKLVSKEEMPKRYEDLLDSKWKGKITLDARGGQIVHLQSLWGEEKFWQFVKALAAQKPIWARRVTDAMSKLVSGEAYIGNASYVAVQQFKSKGAPIEFLFLNPVRVQTRGVSILKASPHPNAAKLFLAWLLSPEGVEATDKHGVGPAVPGTSLYEALQKAGTKLSFDEGFDELMARDKISDKITDLWGALK
ncbi:MAG: extracellular solute-binding protein [Deltaproteobacteria bacterium]|nr:extracellular solute-binding protein [Deltaproteobacteria bacterium]